MPVNSEIQYDVAIIGGGPAGSTVGAILKIYNPALRVLVLEREQFPRDHIGESLLPPISPILHEMGCWDAVEAANFPIKIGATYRWGKKPELWDFDFIPVSQFKVEPRPAKFEGQRRATSFQVDRAIYDKILLDRSTEVGCEVRQNASVVKVLHEEDRVTELVLKSKETVTAKHYVDASGNSGILRRGMEIECDYHTALQNIAIWDYWQNADWAVKIGFGGTRIQVRSLPYGWIWFIPMGPTRTSVGLVIPVEYKNRSQAKPEELYLNALGEEPEISLLLKNADRENKLKSTKDWSFLARRHTGENWYLVGECAGFADPILSAGVTMAHISGHQLAYTINEIEHGGDAQWLKEQFELRQRQRIDTHIRFGNYWYTANEQFEELKEFTANLADSCGLTMSPEAAWDWIARGGFIDEDLRIGIGGFGLASLKESSLYLADLKYDSPLESFNCFRLNLEGAIEKDRASYLEGRVGRTPCFTRDGRVLPIRGVFELLVNILKQEYKLRKIVEILGVCANYNALNREFMQTILPQVMPALEAMIRDGWVIASYDPREPLARVEAGFAGFHSH